MAQSKSQELVEKLAKASPKTKAVVFAFAVGAVGALFYFVGVPPLTVSYQELMERSDQATTRRESLSRTKRDLQKKASEYQQLVKRKEESDAKVRNNLEKLPASAELPSFLSQLQAQMAMAGTELVKWQPDREVPIDTYVKVPVAFELRGEFHQILQFFRLVGETKRVITVENLRVGDGVLKGDRMVLVAKFDVATFRQGDDFAAALAGAPAGKK